MARRFLGGVDLVNQLVTAIGAQMSTGKLLGRSSASSGAIEEISIGTGLSLSSGTLSATGGGGGLTKFTEAESTASPNGTVYVDTLTAAATSTNADVAFVAKGTGATLAQVPDGTTTGGNKRGTYATDWQKIRTAATSVASGNYATIGGGRSNTASADYCVIGGGQGNIAQTNTHATVCGGSGNTASGQYAFVGGGLSNTASSQLATIGAGYSNIVSSNYATIAGGTANTCSATSATIGGGSDNTASGLNSFIGGGRINLANGDFSVIAGGNRGTTRSIVGYHVFPACNVPLADVTGATQSALLLLGRQTTTATATVLTSDSSAAATTNQVTLPNNAAYSFSGEVIAGVTGAGDTARWTINGAIKRGANAASTAMVGTPTVTMTHNDAGAAAWTVAVTANTTLGCITVTVTGAASTTIRWVAKINTTEMTY